MTTTIYRLIWSLVIFYSSGLCGQTTLSGHVATQDNKPQPFTSVILLQDSNFIAGAIADASGNFRIAAALANRKTYTLQLSLAGYLPLSRNFVYPDTGFMAHLILTPSGKSLDEVTVTAKKPLVTRKADRYIVNVENSYLADGNSGLDVLQKSPGLWVGSNGSIRIRGSESVTVMINDVVQRMSEMELADYLRTLRSEDISKIEIIPNPPAEYEASSTGGIVHIILKRSRKEGLTGSLYALYRQQGKNPYSTAGLSIDFKLKRLYFFGSYVFNNDRSSYSGYTNVTYPDKSTLNSNTIRNNNNTRNQFRLGMVYDFSPNHTLNIQTNGTGNNLLQDFHSGIDYTAPNKYSTGNADVNWIRKPWISSTTINYAWKIDTIGSSFKVIADYTGSNKTETNELVSVYSDTLENSWFRTRTPSSTGIYSAQADYTKAYNNKTAVKWGSKYVLTKRRNTIITENYSDPDWTKDPAASNDFKYDETLLMFYSTYETAIGKTSIKGGLRGEQTWSQGHSLTTDESINRNYFSLFPSLFIEHVLNEKKGNSIHFNYSRRVKRPSYNDLNPYRLQVHDYTILTGNPDLLPQYTHSLQTGYTLLQKYTADIYFSSSSNFISQTATTIDSNIIEYKSKNFRNSTEYGLSMNAPFAITKAWNTNNNFLFYHFSSDMNEGRITCTSFSLKSIHTITLKKIMDIDVIAEYSSPYINANARQAEQFYTDIGFTRKILKGKGRLRLYLSDIFNTSREKDLTEYNNTRIEFYQKRPTRTAGISFNYNFTAGKKFIKKKIDQNSSEERSRLGG